VKDQPFYLPKLGMQMQEATLISWLKRPGDLVTIGEALCSIETDKLETELEAEVSGTLTRVEVSEGSTIPVGTLLAVIECVDSDDPSSNGGTSDDMWQTDN
jgi:pyruvate/2-oxoglutarate dehydrogenase complex dihydrolipoamide acyltransferase (E2) component